MNNRLLKNLERLAGDGRASDHPEEVQEKVLLNILKKNRTTVFAQEHSLDEVDSVDAYLKRMPITEYSDYEPYIEQMKSAPNILLSRDFPRWVKTSGTLKSPKVYPLPAEMIEHFGQILAKTIVSFLEEEPVSQMLLGKMLMVVADVVIGYLAGKPVGYISGIVSHDVQKIEGIQEMFTPSCEVLAMENWEARWLEMTRCCSRENVTMTCSTPPVLLSYLRRIADEYSSLLNLPKDIAKIWPNLVLITGSGIEMAPYEDQYKQLVGDYVCCREFYCATEGFFAYQKDEKKGLVPILDHIFYEFIPLKEWNAAEGDYKACEFTRLTYPQIHTNEDYIMAITTPAGLYSYVLGDIVRFPNPDRIICVSRIGWESNATGERLSKMHISAMRKNVEDVLGIEISNLVAAVKEDPLRYVFACEFKGTTDVSEVLETMDRSLREINSQYDWLRERDMLAYPEIAILEPGAFDRYVLNQRKPSLGQVKPPVFVNPKFIDQLKDRTEGGSS